MKTLTDQTYAAALTVAGGVLQFTAAGCQPCRTLEPLLARAERQYPAVSFYSIDANANPQVVERYGINTVPTLLFLKHGRVVHTLLGTVSYRALTAALDWHFRELHSK